MRIVYCSFDAFPSAKGAATHIDAFARALGKAYGDVHLVTLAGDEHPQSRRPWLDRPASRALGEGITHHGFAVHGDNIIARAMCFRSMLTRWWGCRRAAVAHVRSIFEGLPLAQNKRCDKLIYEVNGLPSIELKYHYPRVADDDDLVSKLEAQERRLAGASDIIITPSQVTADELVRRGTPASRVVVIKNGVDEALFRYREPPACAGRPVRLIYAGTMSTWQGVHHLLEALRLLQRDQPAELTLIGPARKRQRRDLEHRARDLGIASQVQLLPPLSREALVKHYHAADVALVPLVYNDRNLVQGCCPLKLIETMAAGVPSVVSDMPATRALADDTQAVFVRPSSPKAIKDGILRVLEDIQQTRAMTRAARTRVERELTWSHAGRQLVELYARLS